MSDLVKRLRVEGEDAMRKHLSLGMWTLCEEAADRIEALEVALAHARAAALHEAKERLADEARFQNEQGDGAGEFWLFEACLFIAELEDEPEPSHTTTV